MSSESNADAVILDRERARARALDLCSFIDASPMPYQAVAECVRRLDAAGYTLLREEDTWTLEPGGRHYVTRNGTTILAFRVGAEPASETGVVAIGAHLDSPNLRVKPHAAVRAHGYRQLGVEVYGGAILATWSDRDLGLAGRVVTGTAGSRPRERVEAHLVTIDRPVARVANAAIHLNRRVNEDGLKLDKQRHMPPILGLDDTAEGEEWVVRGLLGRELGISPDRILDYDLGLFDVTKSCLGGVREEFVFAPRLDNLGCSHAGLEALIQATERSPKAPETSWVLVLFDHEECGSSSAQGAQGTLLAEIVARLTVGHPDASGPAHENVARAAARSYLISADMAHAVHPNYPELHEPSHRPQMNRGPVIKRNENQRYATDGESAAIFAELCREVGFVPQYYAHRSDLPCGGTIGAMAAALTGMKTVDVGNPMLSMHSVRECAGAWDPDLLAEAMAALYR